MRETVRFLLGESYDASKDEVTRQNRMALRYFATAGIPVGIANMIAQMTVRGAAPSLGQHSVWLLGYFALLFVMERFVLPRKSRHATLLAHLFIAPVMLVTILLGTVWDPDHQAMTFLMFMIVMPVFILDRPIRVMAVLTGWNALFILLCVLVKDPSTLEGDLSHTLEFYLLALVVNLVVLRVRFDVLTSLDRTRYHLEHDALTDTRNRASLQRRAEAYVGKDVFVAMGDIDNLTLINDFYGNNVGDKVLGNFCDILKSTFGEDNTYRYGGDDVLCIAVGAGAERGLQLLERCRNSMQRAHTTKLHRPQTLSFGYVTGSAQSVQGLMNMIQLATIYVHRAKRQGEGKTIGSEFNSESLRQGIVESNMTTHARSYEVNQLTGLPTMPYFVARSEELLDHVAYLERSPVIGFVNVVHFRGFNDEFGYEQGDELIRALARSMQEAFPKRHLSYLTGSQFGVVCYKDEIEPGMAQLDKFLSTYKPGHPVVLHAGFAEYHKGDAIISLLDKARLAHGSIEEVEGTSYRLYDERLDQEIRMHQYLTTHLDQAIEKGWLRVHYQPLVDTQTGKTCALEALSRWNDPVYGLLSPLKFIGMLEEDRLVYKLSLHVVKTVLADMVRLRREGLEPLPVSVNLSRNDFFSCDMVSKIAALADEVRMPRNMLRIEITESAFVENQELLRREVDRFHAAGFKVWMDDFGSEYSTLNLLQELNFDLVKLDMQFMRNFDASSRNAVIVSTVIDMCRRMGITTLAEGVETKEQYDLLRQMGCDLLQGYLFSPPRPFADMRIMLEQARR